MWAIEYKFSTSVGIVATLYTPQEKKICKAKTLTLRLAIVKWEVYRYIDTAKINLIHTLNNGVSPENSPRDSFAPTSNLQTFRHEACG